MNEPNHRDLVAVTNSEEKALSFLQKCGVLPSVCFCSCTVLPKQMKLKPDRKAFYFKCSKCKTRKSVKSGTWLSNSRLSLIQTIDLIYFWTAGESQATVRNECKLRSNKTSVDWFRFCREICVTHLMQLDDGIIGGENVVVEIDESKFGHRKYNVGRAVDGTWILGAVERGSNKSFFEPVLDRSEATLIAVIKRRILPGTIILSDMWKGYANLDQEGFCHMTVNHSINFVDPETLAHTQRIECEWSVQKRFLRSIGTNLKMHLIEYFAENIYRRKYRGNLLKTFLQHVAQQFPFN